MAKTIEIPIGNANKERFIYSLSRIVAPKSVWNYTFFGGNNLAYHGKVTDKDFNISPTSYRRPLCNIKGTYISSTDQAIVNKLIIYTKISIVSLIISLVLSIFSSGILIIAIGGNYLIAKYTSMVLLIFSLAFLYHRWLIVEELKDFKKEIIKIAHWHQVKN